MKRKLKPQLDLFTQREYAKRKVARPLSPGSYHHLILKSGRAVLRLHRKTIHDILRRSQLRFGIELKAVAVMENHIHLCVRFASHTAFAHFLRMFSGLVALKVGGGKVWTEKAWTRIIHAFRDLKHVIAYIEGNPVGVGIFDSEDVIHIRRGVLIRS